MDKEHLALMIFDRVDKFGGRTAMRHRTPSGWKDITWYTLGEQIMSIAKALIESGINEGDRIGIYASNCPEWHLADFAIAAVGAVSFPFSAPIPPSSSNTSSIARIKLLFVVTRTLRQGDDLLPLLGLPAARHRLQRPFRTHHRAAEPVARRLLETGEIRREKDVRNRLSHASADITPASSIPGTTVNPKASSSRTPLFPPGEIALETLSPHENEISLCYLPLRPRVRTHMVVFHPGRGA